MPPKANESSPIPIIGTPNNQTSAKKVNRFQVKSIRKSQQQLLLANVTAAKSSNDDDCSVPNENSNLQLKPSIIDRQHANTPTTDGEHSTTTIDNNVNGIGSALKTVENGHHHVRFHVALPEKKELATEDDKQSNQTVVPVPTPATTPAPPSSTASAQGEVRH